MKHHFSRLVLFSLLAVISCKDKHPEPEAPALITGDLFTITGRGTVISGTISSSGGYTLTEAGVVYGTSSAPTVEDVKEKIDMAEITVYPHEYAVTVRGGLPTGTVYYRAYAMASGKAFYGETKRRN